MVDEEKSDKGFTISDRRRFSEGGVRKEKPEEVPDSKEKGQSEVSSDEAKESPSSQPVSDEKKKSEARRSRRAELPEVNFSTFVFSLSSSILIHLGLVPDPTTGNASEDLPLAKQTIDILVMLQEKTRGNLNQEETKLLENLLFDLKMRYVEAVKKESS